MYIVRKKKIKIYSFLAAGVLILSLSGCAKADTAEQTAADDAANITAEVSTDDAANIKTDACYQVATLQSLAKGNYDGYETMEQLLEHGDIGLGTFDELNGEMIVLDGVCYQALSDGSVIQTDLTETTPFASVKWLEDDYESTLEPCDTIEELKTELDTFTAENGGNSIYIGKIEGTFSEITVRSELSQEKPYKELVDVLETDQREYTYEEISGTIVCVYMPDYLENVNTPGWHLHFVDDTRTKGGHVLGLSMSSGSLVLDQADSFVMTMPTDSSFQDMNLTDIAQEDIQKVETADN